METKQQTPSTQGKCVGAKSLLVQYKGKQISLTPLQYKLFSMLSDGRKHSSVELMRLMSISDPRSEVRYLRKYGIEVSDEWHTHPQLGTRYKRYYIALSSNDR